MPANRQPNVIFILTDQQRYDTLGVNGNSLIRTPTLDALAKQSVNFRRAYVTTPICVASRVCMFTGRYTHTNLKSYNNGRLLRETETDLATHFRREGYHTALIGKDHCFDKLRERAFDTFISGDHMGFNFPRNDWERTVTAARKGSMSMGFAQDPIPGNRNVTAILFDEACKFVGKHADQPFFLWLSIPDPHPPYMVGAPYDHMYDDVRLPPPAWRPGEMDNKPFRQRLIVEWDRLTSDYPNDGIDRLRRIYWGMVSCIDDHLARLLKALKQRRLDEKTILVFTSDHGDYMGDHRMIRKGPHVYEALTHVPLIVRWGSRFPARATDAFWANIDLMPTLCELAGLPTPAGVQGVSQAKVLLGQSEQARDMVFLEHGEEGLPLRPGELATEEYQRLRANSGQHLCPTIVRGPSKGVRTGRWKYVYNLGDVDELYDLENDPNELWNLADQPQYAEVVRQHRDHLLRWEVETEDTRGEKPGGKEEKAPARKRKTKSGSKTKKH